MAIEIKINRPSKVGKVHEIVTHGTERDYLFVEVEVKVNGSDNHPYPVVQAAVFPGIPTGGFPDDAVENADELALDGNFFKGCVKQPVAGKTTSAYDNLDLPSAFVVAWYGYRAAPEGGVSEWLDHTDRKFYVAELNSCKPADPE